MSWVFWALGAALCIATADYIVRRHFSDLPLGEVVVARFMGMLPAAVVLLAVIDWPTVDGVFWGALGAALPAELVAMFLYVRALQVSPLALTTPYLAFTPLFALGTGYVINGETPSMVGMLGVVLLVGGTYGLNLNQAAGGWLGPFRAVPRERGSWMMLLVSAIYSYTVVLGKVALEHSSPMFTAAVYPIIIAVAIGLVLWRGGGSPGDGSLGRGRPWPWPWP